jgi:hypothetical protein
MTESRSDLLLAAARSLQHQPANEKETADGGNPPKAEPGEGQRSITSANAGSG